MTTPPPPGPDDAPATRTYAAVLGVEVLVLLALWALGRFFGSD